MLKTYTKEEYRDLYENLPQKIQSLFWDEDVANRIEKIVERFDIDEKRNEKLLQMISFVYFGILPPSHIKKVVEVEISIKDKNEMLSSEIIRLLIAPFYLLLKELYDDEEFKKIGIHSFSKEEEKSKNDFGDVYREPIE